MRTSSARATGGGWEAPTLALAVLIYGGWLALTWFWSDLPLLLALPLGTWLLAWHGSLQHEIIHGHPTPSRRLNHALAWWPIALWLPFELYRRAHLKHHREPWITDPIEDPESAYLTAATWSRLGRAGRVLRRINLTLAGRLVIGPFLAIATIWAGEARRFAHGDRAHGRLWLTHLAGGVAVLVWVGRVCGIPVWLYVLGVVIPSVALSRLRAFAEHRFDDVPGSRTAIVENTRLLGLLFLYNNLHVVHHCWPQLPWYRIPGLYRERRTALLRRNGGLLYKGYRDVARRYLLRAHDGALHPHHLTPAPAQASSAYPASRAVAASASTTA